jgi:hypothetical protein
MGEGLSLGVKCGWSVTLTTHPHLVPRSRMSRSCISSPPWHLHGIVGNLYFYFMGSIRNLWKMCLNNRQLHTWNDHLWAYNIKINQHMPRSGLKLLCDFHINTGLLSYLLAYQWIWAFNRRTVFNFVLLRNLVTHVRKVININSYSFQIRLKY